MLIDTGADTWPPRSVGVYLHQRCSRAHSAEHAAGSDLWLSRVVSYMGTAYY